MRKSKFQVFFVPSLFFALPHTPLLVTFEYDDDSTFSSTFTFQFTPGGIDWILKNDPGSAVEDDGTLIINFRDSGKY